MGIFNEFNKKEKPVFTGSRFGFGAASGPSAPPPEPFSASGGTKTTAGNYVYHDLANGNTFTILTGSTTEGKLLLIGGGGGGAYGGPGSGGQAGGGAGGVIIAPAVTLNTPVSVSVGSGGADGEGQGNGDGGLKGGNSSFGPNWVALGGGGGASPNAAVGSGGGIYGGSPAAYTQSDDPTIPADSKTYGYGNDGGAGSGPPNFGGGGGGGAGGAGTSASPNGSPAATGGAGLPTAPIPWLNGTPFFSPTSQFFAGGGGGAGRRNTSSNGGSGGGGFGRHNSTVDNLELMEQDLEVVEDTLRVVTVAMVDVLLSIQPQQKVLQLDMI